MGDEVATEGVTTDATDTDAVASTGTVLTGDVTASTKTDGDVTASPDSDVTDKTDDVNDAGSKDKTLPPDTYADYVLPEGMELDASMVSEANPLFKELGLNQDQAQKLVSFYAEQAQAGSQKQVDTFNQLTSDWLSQAKTDSEFGGDNFDENVKIAQSAIGKYGTPELKQLLDDYGVGNHPEIIRFMVKVGSTLKEDVPGSAGKASSKATDRVSILYPNNKEG